MTAPLVYGTGRYTGVGLKHEASLRAGCIRLSYCQRGKGPLVGVYRNAESDMEVDPATPWSVVCEEHNTLVCVETRALALSTATDTQNFCDDCRRPTQHR